MFKGLLTLLCSLSAPLKKENILVSTGKVSVLPTTSVRMISTSVQKASAAVNGSLKQRMGASENFGSSMMKSNMCKILSGVKLYTN